LLVTLDWAEYGVSPPNHDTYLIDLERARVVEPPAQFADLTDAVYSADGRFALLFDQHGGIQFWQVDPWRALSAKIVDEHDEHRGHGSWLLGRGGKFALNVTGSNQINLALYDPRDLSARKPMPLTVFASGLPGFTFVTAWAENSTGSQVAIGDSTGHAYLLDPNTGGLRSLPTPLGLEVKWMAFSEDDAWLAAVRRDGAAFAFDVASGDPLNAGQMQQEFDARQVAISHRERLLVASGFGETALWRLRKPGPTGGEAMRLISRPTRSPHALTHAVGASLQTGLLVTTDMGGEVRLWRLPHTPDWPAFMPRAHITIPGSLYFDGEHLPDVAWNKVRIVSTRGAAPTPWAELPQPLGYAELLDGGRTLLATAGPAMYVFDAATMKPRYPAVPLPANPLRMVASADGSLAVFAFGKNGSQGFEEQLQAYDLESGQLRPGGAVVNGPLRQFELSPDAARLLTTGSPHGATEVFASATLKRLGGYPHNPERPVVWASFTPGSERLWLLKRNVDDDTADDAGADLIAWDPVTNVTQEKRFIPGVFAVGLTAATGRPILATREQGLLDPDAAATHVGPGTIRDEATTLFAVSHDGRLLANVFGRDVQLYDAATLAAVGPPLRSYIGASDFTRQLAFSPDDSTLFARKQKGLLWPVRADTRPLAEIRRDAELLSPEAGGQRVLQMPSVEQSKRLRDRDVGALPDSDARPMPPVARIIADVPVPARDSGASPLLLDLTSAYTAAAEAGRNMLASVMPGVSKLPWGIARLDGVDYDVRGIVELRQGSGHAMAGDLQRRAPGIQVPKVPIAAFHVLIVAAFESAEPDERDYASIRLHYVDGSSAVLSIRTQRDVGGNTENDKPVPIAFASGDHLTFIGILKQTLINNPRLPNPHPERLIATLDLETASGKWAEPVFLAITAEPVIAAGNSATNEEKAQANRDPPRGH
jgi:WD40 repeat protein